MEACIHHVKKENKYIYTIFFFTGHCDILSYKLRYKCCEICEKNFFIFSQWCKQASIITDLHMNMLPLTKLKSQWKVNLKECFDEYMILK